MLLQYTYLYVVRVNKIYYVVLNRNNKHKKRRINFTFIAKETFANLFKIIVFNIDSQFVIWGHGSHDGGDGGSKEK